MELFVFEVLIRPLIVKHWGEERAKRVEGGVALLWVYLKCINEPFLIEYLGSFLHRS